MFDVYEIPTSNRRELVAGFSDQARPVVGSAIPSGGRVARVMVPQGETVTRSDARFVATVTNWLEARDLMPTR